MKEPKVKGDGKVKDLPPKKLSVQQEEAVKGGALTSVLRAPDRFP